MCLDYKMRYHLLELSNMWHFRWLQLLLWAKGIQTVRKDLGGKLRTLNLLVERQVYIGNKVVLFYVC